MNMTERKDKASPENEPPEVLAHDGQNEEQPCNGHASCGILQTDEN
jgi:hypothetical protein